MEKTSMLALSALLFGVSQSTYAGVTAPQEIETVLRLKERVSMESLAENVSNPASPLYRHFYTPELIRSLSAPSAEEYAATLSMLKMKGFKIVSESKTHLFLTISGEKNLYEQTFGTQIRYTDFVKNLHSAPEELQIPSDLALVHSLTGLDNTHVSHPFYHSMKQTPKDDPIGSEPTGLSPFDIQSDYGFTPIYNAGINGSGQHIAIATYDGFSSEDVDTYFAYLDINPRPLVDTVLFNGPAPIDYDSATETQLDIEFSGSIAPGAQIHVFTSAQNSEAGELQLFTAILDDNRSKVVNYSWGDCEANVSRQHAQDMQQVFARAVAQGINVTVASGDNGAQGCPETKTLFPQNQYNATFPAAIPYVVAVGGTSVAGGSNGNVKEIAWSGSGGGVSSLFPLPSWQSGFQSPFSMRSFPDVAFNADPDTGQSAYVHTSPTGSEWVQFGGTSIAAPQWAGFLTLVGEARSNDAPVGYLNPILYGLSAAQKTQFLRDVTRGDNGGYKTNVGWDAATGWGSMRASEFLDFLKNN